MEEYGGLIKFMPYTALFFLIGSMAISALPPFNGFFSEWMTYQALFHGITLMSFSVKWIFILATGSLAFTGGLALACFVKVFGVTFLARPRSSHAAHAKESPLSLLVGMSGLSLLSLLIGIFSSNVVFFLEKIGKSLSVLKTPISLASSSVPYGLSINGGFAAVSDPVFFLFFLFIIGIVVIVVRYVINGGQRVTIARTWDCGTDLTPRMEITATGFARSIILIFKGILRPSIQHDISYHDSESRYLPIGKTITLKTRDVHHSHFYQPLYDMLTLLTFRVKKIQSGNTNAYILYIFIALIIMLFFIL
jgi:hydrogenase-4 component B